MSTRSAASNLVQAVKDLTAEWQEAKESWRDAKRDEFERKFLDDLPGYIARTTTAMEEIDGLLKRVRSDCE